MLLAPSLHDVMFRLMYRPVGVTDNRTVTQVVHPAEYFSLLSGSKNAGRARRSRRPPNLFEGRAGIVFAKSASAKWLTGRAERTSDRRRSTER